jgi:sugar phosphate isomerase/epimerase
MTIKLTGFADEAGPTLADQIRAHQELGWDSIEVRMIGAKPNDRNFVALDDAAYRQCLRELSAAKMGISCFGSAIANWARKITGDFQQDLDDLKRAAPRMRETKTRFIRVMSWPNDGLSQADWLKEAARRLKELARIAEGEGVILAHENCSGYGGESPEMLGELLAAVPSPAFKVALDTGNPPAHSGRNEDCVEGRTWAFYQIAKSHIVHVHIKDAKPGSEGKPVFCFPGEGAGEVRRVVADLVKTGYDGYLSIEPHIKSVVHLGKTGEPAGAFETYVEYGRRMAAILDAALKGGKPAKAPKARKPKGGK